MLVFIIGGSNQGKRCCARSLLGLDEAAYQAGLADGCTDAPELAYGKPYLAAYHQMVRKVLQRGGDPEAFTREVLKAPPEVISMDEVGCGIVPVDRAERDYREAVGRVGQMIAARADAVYRVVCGLPVRIK